MWVFWKFKKKSKLEGIYSSAASKTTYLDSFFSRWEVLHFRSGGWKFENIKAVFMFENSSNGILLSKYTNWCHFFNFTL